MRATDLDRDTLRRLAGLRADGGRVLSLFLDLDPRQFATPPARETEITALIDEATRRAEEQELDHDQRVALRDAIGRAQAFLAGDAWDAEGARGLALFCASDGSLFEALRLPEPVQPRAVIDDSPFLEPLVELESGTRWCVALVTRSEGRVLLGRAEAMRDVGTVEDRVHGRHRGGGLSHRRHQATHHEEAKHHFGRLAEELRRLQGRAQFDRLLVGGPEEAAAEFEARLHPSLREKVAGRIRVDVDSATAQEVNDAAAEAIAEHERRRERDLLDRFAEGAGTGGRGAAGLAETLEALNERRVEALLLAPGFAEGGVRCRACGWLGVSAVRCPADGEPVERRERISESATEAALAQDAEVMRVRHHDDLGPFGGIGAVLRF